MKPVDLPKTGRRTNALAFARVDCHTCASLGEQCDRRRPRCSACLDQGRKCQGFATPLSWNPKRMLSSNPSTTTVIGHVFSGPGNQRGDDAAAGVISTSNNRTQPTTQSRLSQSFQFVKGPSKPRKRRKTCPPRTQIRAENQPGVQESLSSAAVPTCLPREEAGLINHDPRGNSLLSGLEPPLADFSLFDSINLDALPCTPLFAMETTASPSSALLLDPIAGTGVVPSSEDEQQQQQPQDPLIQTASTTASGESQRASSVDNYLSRFFPELNVLLNSPRFQTTFLAPELTPNDHSRLLELYDSEFCILPLTGDLSVNPFRCKRQTSQGSRLLFHSILALCCQHLEGLTGSWSKEAEEHRLKATELLKSALEQKEPHNTHSLLEPILILFTLDCALSAVGNWSSHLSRAHSMLWAYGGPNSLTTARVRSQVSMLIWWDVTLALISRQGTIMDREYLDFLIQWEKQDDWSFFDLTGCSGDLILFMYELAELAKQREIANSMKWLTFDVTPVLEIEKELVSWNNQAGSVADEDIAGLSEVEAEKLFHKAQDRHHCAEAWRCALLLYIRRVFKSVQQRPVIAQLVRRIIDHTTCCRRAFQTQKQLLLPVFLAGSETLDQDMRDYVKEYCDYWGKKSRYRMFNTVPLVLDQVWKSGQWWAPVIDQMSTVHGATQLLLG